MKFQHLNEINQEYNKHFKDAMGYSWISFKCSLFFFAHALYPDLFKTNGSAGIKKLNEIIQTKIHEFNKAKDKSD